MRRLVGRDANPGRRAASAAMNSTPLCGRTFFHIPHDTTAGRCLGSSRGSACLAELLDRRPDLVDLTTVTVTNRIQVMCA